MKDPFIEALTKKPSVLGSVYCQDAGKTPDGRRLVGIVAVIAVDNDKDFLNAHQYVVQGNGTTLRVGESIDHKSRFAGYGLGNILREPIWGVG